jgi:hypothetical protein
VTRSVTSPNDASGPTRCLLCGAPLPGQIRPRGGRNLRYCSDACKARAYRARQLTALAEAPAVTLPSTASARYARAIEVHREISELVTALADTASGQQVLFLPGPGRKPARVTAKKLHRLIGELTILAAAAAPDETSRHETGPSRTRRRAAPPAGP